MLHLGANAIARLLGPAEAADAVEAILRGGLDPESGPPRTGVPVPAGELLLMPAAADGFAGVKIAGVAPGNPARGLPRITGSYLLLDGGTLQPVALLDGPALTSLRTPAVSAVAIRYLAAPDASHLVLFGAGPQAYGHLEAARAVRPLKRITVVARRPGPAEALAAHARGLGLEAGTGGPDAVAEADLVICCTTTRTPLFDGRMIAAHATVVAVGSHETQARETDTALVTRATVVVEARSAALREAGDILVPIAEGAFRPSDLAGTLADLVTGRLRPEPGRPRFFKGTGMAWQDLAVAAEIFRAAKAT
ncbi:ornithine cyclodeaminase family protein [Streptomyces sp. H10-C2]|nr:MULTISPECIES: ornithine cyclodeaminase family protein [unclassified Streptomyces]MDJ0344696.1 ornithine cyclodeaminase family protein [Streptomyces sp. PH10-H1]MDJ0372820.1 ornithine cyclodeaminase family protein [Streptomyces sp. H10-C2]